MNQILSLDDLRDYLKGLAGNPFNGVHVDTYFADNYAEALGTVFPALWITGQQFTKKGDGYGYSTQAREHGTIDVAFKLVVPRAVPGQLSAEPPFLTMLKKLTDAMYGLNFQGMDDHFVVSNIRSGPPYTTVVVADVILSAMVTYTKG